METSFVPRHPALRWTVLTAGALLLLGLAPTAVADDGEFDDTPDTPGVVGNATLSNGGTVFHGTYVQGELPADGVILANFTLTNVALFSRIEVAGYHRESVDAEAGVVEAHGQSANLQLTDALAGYLRVELSANASLQVRPADGTTLAPTSNGAALVRGPSREGLLFASCGGAALEFSAEGVALHALDSDCTLFFRAKTSADVLPAPEMDDALSSGDLAAEVSVGGVLADAPVSLVTFTPLEVNVTIGPSRVAVVVAGPSPGGHSVLVLVPRALLDAGDSIEAKFDGRPVAKASSTTDALNARDDAGAPEYLIQSSGNLTAIIITVPHFSAHLFEVAVVASHVPLPPGIAADDALLPVLLGAAVAAGAGAALLRRPKV